MVDGLVRAFSTIVELNLETPGSLSAVPSFSQNESFRNQGHVVSINPRTRIS